MSAQIVRAVIGKGFGDEGKGLAVDYFCSKAPGTLVIKHNGGAQAGHTVEQNGKRFVFHQLSSGSFRHSDTFWADSYYPDLYKLREEAEAFRRISGFKPRILCDLDTHVTLVDDVLINMLLETSRGEKRHGSCGMGINECDLRTKAGFGLTMRDVLSQSAADLTGWVLDVRREYGAARIREAIGNADLSRLGGMASEYWELLHSSAVVENAIEEMLRSAHEYVEPPASVNALFKGRESIVFENGQGLLLDAENLTYAPHVSASRTGLHNPVRLMARHGFSLTEAVYVTRTYVTRHGAGPLPYECGAKSLGISGIDETNITNPWQGSLRYARHGSTGEFLEPVREDLLELDKVNVKVSLMITHLNETDGKLLMADGDREAERFESNPEVLKIFHDFYHSDSREDVKRRNR
ncbi:MAG: adenylosuccinate synthetase [Acetatifactor sp.]|nr:adenylosuccinate synthetase [Acetatifactor sp.]